MQEKSYNFYEWLKRKLEGRVKKLEGIEGKLRKWGL
jgi:hypothetical protein